MLYRRLILGICGLFLICSHLFADSVMEEVVVTAQKKEENIDRGGPILRRGVNPPPPTKSGRSIRPVRPFGLKT